MIEALLGVLALFAVSALLFWLASRSLRVRQVVLRWLGVVFSGLLALLVGALAVLTLVGALSVFAPRVSPAPNFTASKDPQVIARGEHLATILCADCHSLDNTLPLSGGRNLADGAPVPLGFAPAYNLTPAGPLKDWTDGEIFRAIRHNVDSNGRKLAFMNFTGIGGLGDEDVAALVAFLRSQPATGDETRVEKLSLVTYMMIAGGVVPQHKRPEQIDTPAPAPDATYGEYIVAFLSCRDCHGPDLTGGPGGLTPPGPNIVEAASTWTADEFATTLRTGFRPGGRQLVNELMPWQTYGKVNDVEVQAIYEYLRSLKQPIAEK
jgi:mono/diheme cytochrome c family protein